MGYAHGTQWTDEMIEIAIKQVVKTAKINFMPTHTIMKEIIGNETLSNAVRRHGGSKYWAEKLGLEIKPCESKTGYEYECECFSRLTSMGYDCELTKARYPYDILANGNIKIDVKVSHLFESKNGNFYTFHLEKSMPTCDIFVCYCISDNEIKSTFVVPSCVLSGKTQLSIGLKKSKYDKYIDNWNVVKKYDDFYNLLKD